MIDYYDAIERAIGYIEKNLLNPLSVEDVSKNAFQSRWHFQRIFRYVTGYSVYSYIKKRRLAEAGSDLILGSEKVIDIAFKYQYGTPESFLRAFRSEYGVNPSDYRALPEHRIFGPIRVQKKDSPLTTLQARPVARSGFLFVGRKHRTTMQKMQNERDIPSFWQKFFQDGITASIPNKSSDAALGIYTNWDFAENFDVLIGHQVASLSSVPEGLVSHEIAPQKYMVFTVVGNTNDDILNAWKYIYGTWMPETGYERGFAEDFDLFDDRFQNPNRPESEIYIPIQ